MQAENLTLLLNDLCETLGANPTDFIIDSNNRVFLHNRNPKFYHENLFSSKDFDLLCAKHNLSGVIYFNRNATLSFSVQPNDNDKKN